MKSWKHNSVVDLLNEHYLWASVHLGCDCRWLPDLWLAAKSDGTVYRRSCDDCGIIFYRQRVVDVAGLHRADGHCLLAGKTGLLKKPEASFPASGLILS